MEGERRENVKYLVDISGYSSLVGKGTRTPLIHAFRK